MDIKQLLKTVLILMVSGTTPGAAANSVSLEQLENDPGSGQAVVNLNYDFTDFAMFGGGLNIVYDANAIEFVSFTQAELPDDAQSGASPVGQFLAPGIYAGVGIGTFDFINGMNTAGTIGTFVFNFLGGGADTPCGLVICMMPDPFNPFISLLGQDVTDQLIAEGGFGLGVPLNPMPIPAAVWFMLSGLGALAGLQVPLGRKSALRKRQIFSRAG